VTEGWGFDSSFAHLILKMKDHFSYRKSEQLKKIDKSSKGSWDSKIINVCDKINKKEDYYTTSSCSGRNLIIEEAKEKRDDLFNFVSHDLISFEELKDSLVKIKSTKLFYFRVDPCIIHVACRTLEYAQKLHDIAKDAGWKRSGIIASNNRFVLELNGTNRIEMPIMNGGKLIVDDNFLEVLVKEANRKLKISWELIDKLEKSLLS